MSEVLEYDGDVARVSRWAQELLGDHFSVMHRPARMVVDVNSLTRRFGNLTTQYIQVAALLSHYDRACCPAAYIGDLYSVPKNN